MTVAGTVELQSWILSFGQTVEVLEPDELRESVAGRLPGWRPCVAATSEPHSAWPAFSSSKSEHEAGDQRSIIPAARRVRNTAR